MQIQLLQERLAVASRQLFGALSERKPCALASEETAVVPDAGAARLFPAVKERIAFAKALQTDNARYLVRAYFTCGNEQ